MSGAGPGPGRRGAGFSARSPGRFAGDPRGERSGHLAHEWVVQEKEGLRSHDRLAALADDRAGVGPVEEAPEIGRAGAGPHGLKIHGASRDGQIGERRASDRGVEATGHGEQTITNRFRFETPAVHSSEQVIVRVFRERGRGARLLCW